MIIEQFEDKGLAHYSYTIMSEGQIAIVDPARDPQPYYEYANLHDSRIVAVIETHPHADFVSSHYEISTTKEAPIYTSKLTKATYPHKTFDDGDSFKLGDITLHALNTPGHSSDSISVLAKDETSKAYALFSGDTLFVGDVGRPDLREDKEKPETSRESLARALYHTTRNKLMDLPDEVILYPTHGAGSLCGKAISSNPSSTLGVEKQTNPALKEMSEEEFVQYLLAEQPFIPAYFVYDVALNRKGAPDFKASVRSVPLLPPDYTLEKGALVIDTRPAPDFKENHVPGAINLPNETKFETWLGTLVRPNELFYLVAADEATQKEVICKAAKIGYETSIAGALVNPNCATEASAVTNLNDFRQYPERFTIVDVRNPDEVKAQKPFPQSLAIPLPELRDRYQEIPTNKPIMVHCASGYRSAAGSSLLARKIRNLPVYDLGETIQEYI
ncbi:Zn-dependent hydrolase [Adhaeribacter aerolatus]|uniref:Zn-dependent hydrolase n=1 Tax=Adhaeribacter aerolatus TaxID=670289 RepID=A0A512ASI8_9BACT|nr:rhodanese-like domain-containing protein [Adhaeribacter aerolatus]GEO02674.1 Zn-dependent hydrolase [Adhaeribacter aerolatus]